MTLKNKLTNIDDAISLIKDGSSVMIGGFGAPGTPFTLIEALVKQGAKNLTLIKNDANEKDMGIDLLLRSGQVDKLITSHVGLNSNAIELMNAGKLEVEFAPQGILAERVRASGAGLLGFVTDIGIDTNLSDGKTMLEINGEKALFEPALSADFALIHANETDTFGNLVYAATSQNFNPLMAMAAKFTIAECVNVKPLGEIHPDQIHTSGAFVDNIIHLETLSEAYNVIKR